AILAIGGDTAQIAARSLKERLEPLDRERIEEQLSRNSFEEISRRVVEEGLLTQDEVKSAAKSIESTERSADNGEQSPPSLYGLLAWAKILTAFDAETGMWPNRHDLVEKDCAEVSKGKFKPEAAWEEPLQRNADDLDCEYLVRFVYGGRLYIGRMRNFGDW